MNENHNNYYVAKNSGVLWGKSLEGTATVPSLRTTAAIAAMQGILANPSIMASTAIAAQTEAAKQGIELTNEEVSELTINAMAKMAVRCADALITELKEES